MHYFVSGVDNKEFPFECEICGCCFEKSKYLNKHKKRHLSKAEEDDNEHFIYYNLFTESTFNFARKSSNMLMKRNNKGKILVRDADCESWSSDQNSDEECESDDGKPSMIKNEE